MVGAAHASPVNWAASSQMTVTPAWYAASAGPGAQSIMDCPQRSFPATPTGRASQRARVGVAPPPRRGHGSATDSPQTRDQVITGQVPPLRRPRERAENKMTYARPGG